jgi:hypothetical protein
MQPHSLRNHGVVGAASFVCVWGAPEASVSEARKPIVFYESQINCHMDFMKVNCSLNTC